LGVGSWDLGVEFRKPLTVSRTSTRQWVRVAQPDSRIRVLSPDRSSETAADLGARTDAELVAACLEGRREAFDEIVARHQKVIYQLCYRFAGNHADASDLSQETFLRAWRGLRGFRQHAMLRTWLYRIAVNVSMKRVSRQRAPAERVDETSLIDRSSDGPGDRLSRDEQAAFVRRAIAALPNRQRATVILRIYHELPHHEIAAILGSSVGTVKANFFHALRNLRRLIGEPL
jgi:RNA polymerase sigma-70 factor, ECF subfamily